LGGKKKKAGIPAPKIQTDFFPRPTPAEAEEAEAMPLQSKKKDTQAHSVGMLALQDMGFGTPAFLVVCVTVFVLLQHKFNLLLIDTPNKPNCYPTTPVHTSRAAI
jgi:hypothetical protein